MKQDNFQWVSRSEYNSLWHSLHQQSYRPNLLAVLTPTVPSESLSGTVTQKSLFSFLDQCMFVAEEFCKSISCVWNPRSLTLFFHFALSGPPSVQSTNVSADTTFSKNHISLLWISRGQMLLHKKMFHRSFLGNPISILAYPEMVD